MNDHRPNYGPPDPDELPFINTVRHAEAQVEEAVEALERPANAYLRWPWPELDAVTGPLGAGGTVSFVCAFPGSGKTTFVTSAIDLWRRAGKRVYVMPLETQAKMFRITLAALEVGVYPGDATSGNLAAHADGAAKAELLRDALRRQAKRPYADQVMVSDLAVINLAGLRRGLKEAKAFGADVVIVDHIDHIDGESGNPSKDSKDVNQGALQMAQANDLTLLFTSQLNLSAARGPDHLLKYAPPRVEHIWFPGVKLQVGAMIVGLHRKPRAQREFETDDEYAKAIKAARAGELPPPDVLDPGIMGVNAMKLRNYGSREGSRVYLGFEHGRVVSLAERDRYATDGRHARRIA